VASQRPEGGRRVKIGRIVNLIVSVLDKKAIVPNLLGRSHNDIEVLLAARGLVSGEVSFDYVPGVEGGVVLTQNPLPDEEIDPGAAVAVTVSSSWEIGPSDSRTEKAGQVESATKEKEGGFKLW
jgi:serine/threonine-protein kinase